MIFEHAMLLLIFWGVIFLIGRLCFPDASLRKAISEYEPLRLELACAAYRDAFERIGGPVAERVLRETGSGKRLMEELRILRYLARAVRNKMHPDIIEGCLDELTRVGT